MFSISGFTVGMQVPSLRNKGQLLHGVMLSLVGQTDEDITLSIQSARTSAQINQYHAELSHVFNELRDEVIKKKTKDVSVCSSLSASGGRVCRSLIWEEKCNLNIPPPFSHPSPYPSSFPITCQVCVTF